MYKFDTSIGFTKKPIDIIKYKVKVELSKELPVLPEPVEMKLFFEGRDAWVFSWSLNKKDTIESKNELNLDVVVKLKKEFHQYNASKQYKYSCMIKLRQDLYGSKVKVTKSS